MNQKPLDALAHSAPDTDSLSVTVIGTGYVGLVTAACVATLGHRVTAIDVDADRIDRLAQGELPFHEAGLAELVRQHVASGRLRFSGPDDAALSGADVVFIAVGTPGCADGSTDMSAIDAVVSDLQAQVRWPTVVVMKSTVPVGTTRRIEAMLAEPRESAEGCEPRPGCGPCQGGAACEAKAGARHGPRVLSNPEFLREGCAVEDFMQPDRIIIGDDAPADDRARRVLLRLYAPLVAAGVPVLTMDTRSAELSKYAANAMLAMRISFINEVAAIAAATGADIEQVSAGIGSDHRIGSLFLRPGLGFGGSCFPKDLAALRETARRHNLRSDILLATQRVNDRQRCWAMDALVRDLGSRDQLRSMRIALWGLAFKPGTDDTREAPSLVLLSRLSRAGAIVSAYDPAALRNARAALGDPPHVTWVASAAEALRDADVLMLATEWQEFVDHDPRQVAAALSTGTVYDGRNALDAAKWSAAGLRVVQVGHAPPARRRMTSTAIAPAAVAPVAVRSPSWIVTA